MTDSLDRRRASILRAVIREHVRTGEPVGSKTLIDRYRLKVSSATVRNDMTLLEELGYITQPHTSAGRIPTELGYRWYVDTWPAPPWPDLGRREKLVIGGLARAGFRGLEDALEGTTQVLSEVTEATSVVVSPPSRKNVVRRVELLFRDPTRATLLLIADTGVVRQGIVEFGGDRTEDELRRLERALNKELEGEVFEEVAARLRTPAPGKTKVEEDRLAVAEESERILDPGPVEKIFRGGTARILDPEKFSDPSVVQEVIEALEDPSLIANLIDAAIKTDAILVYIGSENPIEKMQSCAVVFAPYEIDEGRQGTLGIVGPLRMDYPHTISAVEAVASSLSRLLTDQS